MSFSRRHFLAATAGSVLTAAQQRPNILFIFTDDHHYQCFGAAGNPHIRTPNMDRIASRGVHFTNAVISTSQCAPSRGIIISGRETHQTGLRSNGPIGILFSVICIVVAALSFILSFDEVERGVRMGLPQRYSWIAAFGILVSLIWLYLEILRLLSFLQGRD